jgi:hypothetical protein
MEKTLPLWTLLTSLNNSDVKIPEEKLCGDAVRPSHVQVVESLAVVAYLM